MLYTYAYDSMRVSIRMLTFVALTSSCVPRGDGLTEAERQQISAEIRDQVVAAYDLSAPNAVERLMSLYPPSGPVYSAGAGRFSASRDTLAAGIEEFWQSVGQNMRDPTWEWTAMQIDVLSGDAAVMTATYRVPHNTPRGEPHMIGGAWTAVFARRNGRWEIVHEHLSDVPVVPDEVVRAATDSSHDAHEAH